MAVLQYKVCLEHQKCIVQIHVCIHCKVCSTLSIIVKYTPYIWCALHTLKSVRIETLLAHHIWCVVHTIFGMLCTRPFFTVLVSWPVNDVLVISY